MKSSALADLTILTRVKESGEIQGLKEAAKILSWPLNKTHNRYKEISPVESKAVAISVNNLCSNKWEFADLLLEYKRSGQCETSLASLMKCTPITIQKWIKAAETFPPELRSENVSASTYAILMDLPNPVEVAEYIVSEQLTNSKAIQIRKKYSASRRGGRPFALLDVEKLIELHSEGKTDSEIADALKVARTTVINWRRRMGLEPVKGVGERGKSKPKEIVAEPTPAVPTLTLAPPPDAMDAIKDLTLQLNQLEAENRALKKQCMTYLAQLASMTASMTASRRRKIG